MLQRYLLACLLVVVSFAAGAQPAIEFVRNDGQWDGPFIYKALSGHGDVFLSPDHFTYLLGDPSNPGRMDGMHHGLAQKATLKFHAYRMYFDGAAAPKIVGEKEQRWYYNFFLGNDSSRWHSGIHPCLTLNYEGLYPGIDMHISSSRGNLEYEFALQAGSKASVIRLRYDGPDGLSIKNGNLIIKTSVGDVQELSPYAYQPGDDGKKTVICHYRLKGNTITYDFPNGYDTTQPMVIDPTVVFCTFTGSTADNWGFTATYDNNGDFYAGGLVNDNGYPVSTGAFQSTFAGGYTDLSFTNPNHGSDYASDIGIIKFDPTGVNKLWATYLGGSDNEQPHSLIVDASDNLIIAGRSFSTNFPVTQGAYHTTAGGKADIIVAKLNSTGTALIGSTYVGGTQDDGINYNPLEAVYGNLKHNYGDDARSEVIVDKTGNIYVTSSTKSTDFPVTGNAYQSTLSGTQDAVVFKLNSTLTSLLWSTYLGGSNDDAGYVLALDTTQTALYVGGGTQSTNFPAAGTTWHSTYQGGAADGFVARFGNGGAYPLQKVCFVGTANEDQVYGLQVDLENNVYAMGQSIGGTFPTTAGVYKNANSTQFIIKMDSLLTTDVFSTVYGSGDANHTNISPVAFLVDTCQNIYISGWGGNLAITTMPVTIGTTNGMPVSVGNVVAPLSTTTDGNDFYFIVLSKNALSLLYGAFLGRSANDPGKGEHVDGGTSRFDKHGVVYQAICGGCAGYGYGPGYSTTAFPTTAGSYSPNNGFPTNCNEVALKIAFQLSAVNAGANASPNAKGCPPFTVQFQNGSINATGYNWDFNDNTGTNTSATPVHTFTSPGIYHVRLIALNPLACKTRDTAYLIITVDSTHITSAFNTQVLDSCGPYRASFANASTYSGTPGSSSFTKFTWLFGDNTSYVGVNPPIHSYSGAGSYTVRLIMTDSTACNSPDTSKRIINMNGFKITAAFNSPDTICLSNTASFVNSSTNATTSLWSFGDGQSSTQTATTHSYTTAGTYTILLVVTNPQACNKSDTFRRTIVIRPLPKAAFTSSPILPVPNTPVNFTNQSTNASTYNWNFGDGNSSTDFSPNHLFRHTGHFLVCLYARSTEGCIDSVCKYVDADIKTAADLPTAFSPNGDGKNDILYVRGGAIETMDLKIFNRWGQLVFESTSLDYGWDGTYKGKPQEMEAYAFVLNVAFIDGTTFRKQGNVTLLR